MKKILSVFLALVLTLTCVLGSVSSVFAFNDGMTESEVFDMCWNLACSNCNGEGLRNCFDFLNDFQYSNMLLDTASLISDSCMQSAREAIRKVGTDPEELGLALQVYIGNYIIAYSSNMNVQMKLVSHRSEYREKLAKLLAESYNNVKDTMNGEVIIEFSSDKYGDEIAKYFDKHKDEVAAVIPQEYITMLGGNVDGIINAAELYLQNNQEYIVGMIDELLNSDDTLDNKRIAIQEGLSDVLIEIIESFLGEGMIPRESLESSLANVVTEYSAVICEQFEVYLATMTSDSSPAILSGCICLVVGAVVGIFIERKKKQTE